MSTELVLKWSWRHRVLQVDEFDSLDEAVSSAYYGQEAGEEAPDHIEVVTDLGQRVVSKEELAELINARESVDMARYQADTRPVVAKIHIATTDGQGSAVFEWYRDMESAERDTARLTAILGGRVRLERVT